MLFVDTNVLLYAASTDRDELAKTEIARSILENEDLALSVQVLQEFYVQSTHARRGGTLTHDQAARLIESFLRFPVQETTVEIMEASLRLAKRFQISYWDAAIIEAARVAGCSMILSEDLSGGQDYEGITVTNPFRKSSHRRV